MPDRNSIHDASGPSARGLERPLMPRLMDGTSPTRLFVGGIATGLLALSVHVGLQQGLGVPFPAAAVNAPIWQYISRGVLYSLGLIWLCRLAMPGLGGGLLRRWLMLFFVSTMLTESLLRGPFMAGYCTQSFLLAFASAVPGHLVTLVLTGAIAAVAPVLTTTPRKLLMASLAGAVSLFVLRPASNAVFAAPLDALAFLAGKEWCVFPYGWEVLLPAYLSFAEPTVAAFAVAALVWKQLPGGIVCRVAAFTLIIMLIRRQLLAAPIYALWSEMPALHGLAAMGQFSLEAMLLGLLTGVCWHWASSTGSGGQGKDAK